MKSTWRLSAKRVSTGRGYPLALVLLACGISFAGSCKSEEEAAPAVAEAPAPSKVAPDKREEPTSPPTMGERRVVEANQPTQPGGEAAEALGSKGGALERGGPTANTEEKVERSSRVGLSMEERLARRRGGAQPQAVAPAQPNPGETGPPIAIAPPLPVPSPNDPTAGVPGLEVPPTSGHRELGARPASDAAALHDIPSHAAPIPSDELRPHMPAAEMPGEAAAMAVTEVASPVPPVPGRPQLPSRTQEEMEAARAQGAQNAPVGGTTTWAGAPRLGGPALDISNAITRAELERMANRKLKLGELAGIEPGPNYNSLFFETKEGQFAAAVQVWAESTIKDTRQRYDQMKATYPNVRDTTNITPYTFFASWGSTYTMAFMDLKRRRVVAVSCNNDILRPNQLYQIAKTVQERTLQ